MRRVLVGAVESTRVALLPESKHLQSDYVDLAPVARENDAPLKCVRNVNYPESLNCLRELAPDHVFVVGWSQVCRAESLALPRNGGLVSTRHC